MQIVDDSTPTQIKEVFALSTIAGASALPPTDTDQRMLHSDSFTQFGPPFWRQLALA